MDVYNTRKNCMMLKSRPNYGKYDKLIQEQADILDIVCVTTSRLIRKQIRLDNEAAKSKRVAHCSGSQSTKKRNSNCKVNNRPVHNKGISHERSKLRKASIPKNNSAKKGEIAKELVRYLQTTYHDQGGSSCNSTNHSTAILNSSNQNLTYDISDPKFERCKHDRIATQNCKFIETPTVSMKKNKSPKEGEIAKELVRYLQTKYRNHDQRGSSDNSTNYSTVMLNSSNQNLTFDVSDSKFEICKHDRIETQKCTLIETPRISPSRESSFLTRDLYYEKRAERTCDCTNCPTKPQETYSIKNDYSKLYLIKELERLRARGMRDQGNENIKLIRSTTPKTNLVCKTVQAESANVTCKEEHTYKMDSQDKAIQVTEEKSCGVQVEEATFTILSPNSNQRPVIQSEDIAISPYGDLYSVYDEYSKVEQQNETLKSCLSNGSKTKLKNFQVSFKATDDEMDRKSGRNKSNSENNRRTKGESKLNKFIGKIEKWVVKNETYLENEKSLRTISKQSGDGSINIKYPNHDIIININKASKIIGSKGTKNLHQQSEASEMQHQKNNSYNRGLNTSRILYGLATSFRRHHESRKLKKRRAKDKY